jgi:hypothetical protein
MDRFVATQTIITISYYYFGLWLVSNPFPPKHYLQVTSNFFLTTTTTDDDRYLLVVATLLWLWLLFIECLANLLIQYCFFVLDRHDFSFRRRRR